MAKSSGEAGSERLLPACSGRCAAPTNGHTDRQLAASEAGKLSDHVSGLDFQNKSCLAR